MSDLISRQAAIDAVQKHFAKEIDKTPHEIDADGDDVYTDMETVYRLLMCKTEISKAIKALPSAELPKGDLISRQDATSIPILPKDHRKKFNGVDDAYESGWNDALSCVNDLPSARPTGHWIKESYIGWRYECPLCGHIMVSDDELDFCPSCGADMRGGDTE